MSQSSRIIRRKRMQNAAIVLTSGLALAGKSAIYSPVFAQFPPNQGEWYERLYDGDPSNDPLHGVGYDMRTQEEGGLSCKTDTGARYAFTRYGWWNPTDTSFTYPYGMASWDGVGAPYPDNFIADYDAGITRTILSPVSGIFAYRPLGSTSDFTLANITTDSFPNTFPAMSEGFFLLPRFDDIPVYTEWEIGEDADNRPGGLTAGLGSILVMPPCSAETIAETQQIFYPEPLTVNTCYYDNPDGMTRTAVYDWSSSAPFDYDWPAGSAEPLNQQFDSFLDPYRRNSWFGFPDDIGQPTFFPAGGEGEFRYAYPMGEDPPQWRIDSSTFAFDPCPERAPVVATTTSSSTTSTTASNTTTSAPTTSTSLPVSDGATQKNVVASGKLPKTGSSSYPKTLYIGFAALGAGFLLRLRTWKKSLDK